jgi:pantoate--beta-alanine ligase
MKAAIAGIEAGEPVAAALAGLNEALLDGGFSSVDYAELRDADALTLLSERGEAPMRLLVAARIGTTRLIDNMAVAPR